MGHRRETCIIIAYKSCAFAWCRIIKTTDRWKKKKLNHDPIFGNPRAKLIVQTELAFIGYKEFSKEFNTYTIFVLYSVMSLLLLFLAMKL